MLFQRPTIIRPPSEWKSYFLPLTNGCSNNTCTFCNYYGSRLQIRELEDVKEEIDTLTLYMQKGVYVPGMPDIIYAICNSWDGKMVFLQDGDALVYPILKLKEALEYINEKCPSVERIATYATAQDILRINLNNLKELKRLKLGILYMGLESGDDEVLRRVGKGVHSRQMIEASQRAKEAGILTSVIFILGLGGMTRSEKHALETSRVLSAMDPDYVGALTLTLVPGTPLYKEWQQGNFSLVNPHHSLKELFTIIKSSSFSHCFFSSTHASNYFTIRGTLPHNKERMMQELTSVIKSGDPSSLKPEFLRGL
ncbi:radical SAM protein [Chloroflexota bacterium]